MPVLRGSLAGCADAGVFWRRHRRCNPLLPRPNGRPDADGPGQEEERERGGEEEGGGGGDAELVDMIQQRTVFSSSFSSFSSTLARSDQLRKELEELVEGEGGGDEEEKEKDPEKVEDALAPHVPVQVFRRSSCPCGSLDEYLFCSSGR